MYSSREPAWLRGPPSTRAGLSLVTSDSSLAVAGQLDTTLGGPIIDEKLGLTSKRRSLYFRFNAEYKMSFLDQFDAASPTECYERQESIIPQQALALHNSALALNASREVAKQLAKEKDATAFVTAAFERILGRHLAEAPAITDPAGEGEAPLAPGQLASHYAPRARLRLAPASFRAPRRPRGSRCRPCSRSRRPRRLP